MAYYMTDEEIKTTRQEATEQDDDDLSRLADQCAALTLQDGKFSEVISLFCVSEGKSVKVHKCILAQSSPVFATMLINAEMKQNIVEIVDVAYDVLIEVLRYIYTGKVRNIDKLVGELATAADAYALDGLKLMCEETMTEKLSLDNVVAYLQLANGLRMDKLKGKATEFIFENASYISDKPEFKILLNDDLCKVICYLSLASLVQ